MASDILSNEQIDALAKADMTDIPALFAHARAANAKIAALEADLKRDRGLLMAKTEKADEAYERVVDALYEAAPWAYEEAPDPVNIVQDLSAKIAEQAKEIERLETELAFCTNLRARVEDLEKSQEMHGKAYEARIEALETALREIATFGDPGAEDRLARTGSYALFDEPGSVEIARKALAAEDPAPEEVPYNSPPPKATKTVTVRPVPAETCRWTEDEDEGSWPTSCDNKHCFIDGGPTENSYTFCPYCGRPIEIVEEGDKTEEYREEMRLDGASKDDIEDAFPCCRKPAETCRCRYETSSSMRVSQTSGRCADCGKPIETVEKEAETCRWTECHEDTWQASCQDSPEIVDWNPGGICHHCGKPIEIVEGGEADVLLAEEIDKLKSRL